MLLVFNKHMGGKVTVGKAKYPTLPVNRQVTTMELEPAGGGGDGINHRVYRVHLYKGVPVKGAKVEGAALLGSLAVVCIPDLTPLPEGEY